MLHNVIWKSPGEALGVQVEKRLPLETSKASTYSPTAFEEMNTIGYPNSCEQGRNV